MIVAIIIAGGIGSRMRQEIPKQFINIYDKPVLVYTLEAFQNHPLVDAIEVVCLEGWEHKLVEYSKKWNINKLKWIVKGGATGQESIRNGVYNLQGKIEDDDICLIHDGVRPMLDPEVITDVIRLAKLHGNAVTSMPYYEQIFLIDKHIPSTTTQYIPRENLRRVSTPQGYKFNLLNSMYHEAFARKIGISGSNYTNTMMVQLGVRLYFATGSDRNIKLTTPENLDFFRSWVSKQNSICDKTKFVEMELKDEMVSK